MMLSPFRIALIVTATACATLGGAWFIQLVLGVLPCHLCLIERIPYYASLPLGLLAIGIGWRAPQGLPVKGLVGLLALVFAIGTVLGAYHAGVEFGIFQGPTDCTGTIDKPVAIDDFLKSLDTVKVIRCDEVAMRIFGLSLAAWNAVISLGLTLAAAVGTVTGRR
jgi:disulfide bond formation protein DsbB